LGKNSARREKGVHAFGVHAFYEGWRAPEGAESAPGVAKPREQGLWVCDALGEPTEAEKVGAANIESAKYARKGYQIALVALGVAIVSLAVALGALFK
jgi:hypothetical protein